jgi:hypothetical protein
MHRCVLYLLNVRLASTEARSGVGYTADLFGGGWRSRKSMTLLLCGWVRGAQMAKDVLMQDIKFLQNLAPRQGVQTTLTSFRKESVN